MTGRFGGAVMAIIIVALSASATHASPVDVSADQDTVLRHLFGRSGAGSGGSGAAPGNPYLKPAEKPVAVPLPRVPSTRGDPINLLPPDAQANGGDATPAGAAPSPANRRKPVKKP